jgi:hypothetical protein
MGIALDILGRQIAHAALEYDNVMKLVAIAKDGCIRCSGSRFISVTD